MEGLVGRSSLINHYMSPPNKTNTAQGLLPPGRRGARGAGEPREGGTVRWFIILGLWRCWVGRLSNHGTNRWTYQITIAPTRRSTRLLSPLLNWTTLEKVYPRYPHIRDIRITERDRQCVIDLRSFMSTAPYVINESASLVRCVTLLQFLR